MTLDSGSIEETVEGFLESYCSLMGLKNKWWIRKNGEINFFLNKITKKYNRLTLENKIDYLFNSKEEAHDFLKTIVRENKIKKLS